MSQDDYNDGYNSVMDKLINEMPGTYVCFEDMQQFMAQEDRIKELEQRITCLEEQLTAEKVKEE